MHHDLKEVGDFFNFNLVAKVPRDTGQADQHLDKHLLQVELVITSIMVTFLDIILEVQVLWEDNMELHHNLEVKQVLVRDHVLHKDLNFYE
jgi:hypothetical protein